MINKKNKIYFKEFIFFFSFFLYYISRFLQYTAVVNEHNCNFFLAIKTVSYIFAVLGIIYNFFGERVLKINILILVLVLDVLFQSLRWNENSVAVVFLFSCLFNTKSFKTYLYFCLYIGLSLYIGVLCLCFFDFISNIVSIQPKLGILWERYSLGFEYPGQTIMSLSPLIMIDTYLHKRRKQRVLRSCVWLAFVIFLFYYSRTLMPVIMTCFYLFLANLNLDEKLLKRNRTLFAYIVCSISLLLVLFRYYEFELINFLDHLLNYRLSLSLDAIYKYGITFWGTGFVNYVNEMNYEYLFLDSEYSHILITNGVIHLIVSIFIFNSCMNYAIKNKDSDMVLIFYMIAINSIVNNGIYNLVFNPFIIILFVALKDKNSLVYNDGILYGKDRAFGSYYPCKL